MTKNRFLSKRLACLLTTALISTSLIPTNVFATAYVNGEAVAGGDLAAGNHTIAGTVTIAAAATAGNFQILDTGVLSFLAGNTTGFTHSTAITADAADSATAILITTVNTTNPTTAIVTFSGQIGTSTIGIDTITLGTASALAGSAIFSADVFATTVAVQGADVNEPSTANFRGNVTSAITLTIGGANEGTANVVYSGTGAQTQTGAITAASDGTAGTLSVTNTGGLVTFANAIGTGAAKLTSATTSANSTVLFSGAVAANTLTINGSAFLSAVNNTSEAVVLGETSKLFTGRNISNGLVAFSDVQTTRPTLATGSEIHISPVITNGQTVVLFDGADTIGDDADTLVEVNRALRNNALFTYVATTDADANATVVTATARSATATASQLGVNLNKGTAFIQAHAAALASVARDDAAFENFEQTIQAVGFGNPRTAASDTFFANQVAPQTDLIAGSTVAAKAVTSGVQNVISTRLASLRSGDGYSTGVVTGSGMSANSGFIQGFGSTVEQKNKGNEFGYDADTKGFAIGFDGKVSDGVVVGISYANSNTDVDGKGTGKAKNDIKTNSGSIYADYATKRGYIEGSLTYGKSDNTTSRLVEIDGTNRTYKADYDSEQYSFRLFGGVPQSVGVGAFFTPFAGATISQIKADAYTERSTTANDSLRLRVSQDTVDSQVGTVGIKYHQVIKDGKTTFTPEVKLALNQEFGDGDITTTNNYQGGGASFKNSTEIEKTSATAGIGLNISADNLSFNIGYEADAKEKYLGHSAQAKITAKF
jgi:uncharacterized protein with beta-barrel porin domain